MARTPKAPKMPKMPKMPKCDMDMLENIIIFVLLVIIIVLLVQKLMPREDRESFKAEGQTVKLVLYYAPWCPHCTGFMKEWKKLGEKQQINGMEVSIEKVDCDKNADVARAEKIEGFPTVKLHSTNGTEEYMGERDHAALISWLQQRLK